MWRNEREWGLENEGSGNEEAKSDYLEQIFTAREGLKVVHARMFITALFITVNS